MSLVIKIRGIIRDFPLGQEVVKVLKGIDLDIERGEYVALMGPSGSGKSTLMNLLGCLDTPTGGTYELNGVDVSSMTDDELAEIRNKEIGFVFQTFQLVPTLTAVENVMVPLELRGEASNKVRERALELLNEVGLGERSHHYPTQLSGGEQQRVAVARAFINNPKILFADEPTGNLDSETGEHIENLIFDLNRKEGTTLVLVTHDLELAEKCDRVIKLKNGEVDSDVFKSEEVTA